VEVSKEEEMATSKLKQRIKRKVRARKKFATSGRPRLSVYRSLRYVYAQIIDDKSGKTLISQSDLKLAKKGLKTEIAYEVGKRLAAKAAAQGIKVVVFDRGGFLYHGIVAKLAEGAREGGLKF